MRTAAGAGVVAGAAKLGIVVGNVGTSDKVADEREESIADVERGRSGNSESLGSAPRKSDRVAGLAVGDGPLELENGDGAGIGLGMVPPKAGPEFWRFEPGRDAGPTSDIDELLEGSPGGDVRFGNSSASDREAEGGTILDGVAKLPAVGLLRSWLGSGGKSPAESDKLAAAEPLGSGINSFAGVDNDDGLSTELRADAPAFGNGRYCSGGGSANEPVRF